jgi:guanylate kinase
MKEKIKLQPDLLGAKALYLFIAPPSLDVLEERLRNRNTETEESLKKRLDAASLELEWGMKPGAVDFVIVNHTVDVAYKQLVQLLKAEKILE